MAEVRVGWRFGGPGHCSGLGDMPGISQDKRARSLHSIYIFFLHPKLPASLTLRLCSLTRSCHGLELWNTSLREVSAWKKTVEGLNGPSLERLLFPSLDTDAEGGVRQGLVLGDRNSRLRST